jgi:hypothetical protein
MDYKDFLNEAVLKPSHATDEILQVNRMTQVWYNQIAKVSKNLTKKITKLEKGIPGQRRLGNYDSIKDIEESIAEHKRILKDIDSIWDQVDQIPALSSLK